MRQPEQWATVGELSLPEAAQLLLQQLRAGLGIQPGVALGQSGISFGQPGVVLLQVCGQVVLFHRVPEAKLAAFPTQVHFSTSLWPRK